MVVLFLTNEEQKALSDDVRSKCPVQPETLTYQDTEEQRASRMRTMSVKSPELRHLQQEAKTKVFDPDEIAKLAESVDFSKLEKHDLMELAFAWGPDVFTVLIAQALPNIQTEKDIADLSALTDIRHGLLLAMNR